MERAARWTRNARAKPSSWLWHTHTHTHTHYTLHTLHTHTHHTTHAHAPHTALPPPPVVFRQAAVLPEDGAIPAVGKRFCGHLWAARTLPSDAPVAGTTAATGRRYRLPPPPCRTAWTVVAAALYSAPLLPLIPVFVGRTQDFVLPAMPWTWAAPANSTFFFPGRLRHTIPACMPLGRGTAFCTCLP